MATVVPAISGQMGSTPYFLSKMKANELAGKVRPPSEKDGWTDLGIEERMQRDVNWSRVEKEIAPYLARAKDRFFGAFVVLVDEGELDFEPVTEIGGKVPAAYKATAKDLGFLSLSGGQMIVLDGQHRLAALRTVITGHGKGGRPVTIEGPYAAEVGNDDVEVVFIDARDDEKIRRIFNKLNRHAKPTGRGDNIITSEDDGHAVLTRWLLRKGEPLGVKVDVQGGTDYIVNWKSNTISARSTQFTTISAVYETVKTILEHHGITNFDEKSQATRPEESELDNAYDLVKEWWDEVLGGVEAFEEAFSAPSKIPEFRTEGEPHSLLFKPATHIILFKALSLAVDRGLRLGQAVARVNKIDWNIEADHWKHILIRPNGRISAAKQNYDVTAEFVGYLITGDMMGAQDRNELQQQVAGFRGEEGGYRLPPPVA